MKNSQGIVIMLWKYLEVILCFLCSMEYFKKNLKKDSKYGRQKKKTEQDGTRQAP